MFGRGLRKGWQPLAACGRSISTTVQCAAAVPAVSTSVTGGGFLSKLFGKGSRITVPLTDPLPGLELPPPASIPAEAPTTQLSVFDNGFRIASEANVGPTVSLGLYVDAGSVYESPANAGVSHLLEYMAFKTTANRTHFRLVKEVEAIGANVLASASREQMSYVIDCVSTNVPQALEILADAVLNPVFHPWEVKEQMHRMEADLKQVKDNPQTTLVEALHATAYTGGLGRPLVCPPDHVSLLSPSACSDFVDRLYAPKRMVLSGAGIDHDALVAFSKPLFGDSIAVNGDLPEPTSTYVGGDWRQYALSPLTHAILAFEAEGGWRDVKGATAVTVLQYLMGGGGSFSAGGPGKGMHSRLYKSVLNQHGWVHNCSAFNTLYNDTGLVGVSISAESNYASQMIDVATSALQGLADNISEQELARAKNATVSAVMMNLETRAIVSEDIGRQVLTYNRRYPVEEFMSTIAALTPKDMTGLIGNMLKKPVSMAIVGDIVNAPRYDAVASRFG